MKYHLWLMVLIYTTDLDTLLTYNHVEEACCIKLP